jgi:Uma2 family endonuclease
MGEAALRIKMTEEEYLAFERASDEKHEYIDGALVVMPKDTDVHDRVPLPIKLTEEEYLAFDAASELKYEYIHGQVFAMSGGTGAHGRIAMSIGAELRSALRGRKCGVHSSDVRVHIPESEHYVYPDVSVACGGVEYKDASNKTLLNPRVIVEVLSPSTEGHDRGDKFALYRTIPSVTHYVLAAQDKPFLEVYTRQDDGSWNYRAYGPGEKAPLSAIACELDVDLVYTDVFDESLGRANVGDASR